MHGANIRPSSVPGVTTVGAGGQGETRMGGVGGADGWGLEAQRRREKGAGAHPGEREGVPGGAPGVTAVRPASRGPGHQVFPSLFASRVLPVLLALGTHRRGLPGVTDSPSRPAGARGAPRCVPAARAKPCCAVR